jgi:hypothetical protein
MGQRGEALAHAHVSPKYANKKKIDVQKHVHKSLIIVVPN